MAQQYKTIIPGFSQNAKVLVEHRFRLVFRKALALHVIDQQKLQFFIAHRAVKCRNASNTLRV